MDEEVNYEGTRRSVTEGEMVGGNAKSRVRVGGERQETWARREYMSVLCPKLMGIVRS